MKRIARSLRFGGSICAFAFLASSVRADPIPPGWAQPDGPGTPVTITYSYSNLLDGSLLLISSAELRAATEEALALWAAYAPLHFVEVPDSGPGPSATPYDAEGHPQIRIGHSDINDLARAYFPDGPDGLRGDIHFDAGIPWTLGTGHWNFLEAITHELGHSVGLRHELVRPAIMNPSYPQRRFGRLGTAFLLPDDIEAIQAIYGAGRGSVDPPPAVPEPAAAVLVASGLAALGTLRKRRQLAAERLISRLGAAGTESGSTRAISSPERRNSRRSSQSV